MIYNIIGCGETGSYWDGHGLSIGVNDCEKNGKGVAALILINHPNRFPGERINTIKASKAKIYTDTICANSWKKHFSQPIVLNLHRWAGGFSEKRKDRVYHSNTSPFVAMSLAFVMGATELVLWGVDFQNHHKYSPGKSDFNNEVHNYLSLSSALKRKGCKVNVGHKDSFLYQFLPVYNPVLK